MITRYFLDFFFTICSPSLHATSVDVYFNIDLHKYAKKNAVNDDIWLMFHVEKRGNLTTKLISLGCVDRLNSSYNVMKKKMEK